MTRSFHQILAMALMVSLAIGSSLLAQSPTVADALQLQPLQKKDIGYDTPTTQQRASCSIRSEVRGKTSGWVVRDASQRLLRRFLDTNADNKIDQWCYYKDGIEVYRDIDADFNGKADQYRWLGTAGTRWGLDTDEDGVIDHWKRISAEEVTAEIVRALAEQSVERFGRVLLSKEELGKLKLGDEQAKRIASKISTARSGFSGLAKRQQTVTKQTRWVNFGGTRPGVIPAGTEGSLEDLTVYENVAVVVENGGKHGQLVVGTLVQVGQSWRVIDAPHQLVEGQAGDGGFFFQASLARIPETQPTEGGLSESAQKLVSEMEVVDRQLNTATDPAKIADLNRRRADVLEKLARESVQPKDKSTWVRQYADALQSAVQTGHYASGVERLQKLATSLGKGEDQAYVQFRSMTAAYGHKLQQPNAEYEKIQTEWSKNLEAFVSQYPRATDAAEAMLQLAVAKEFAGESNDAAKWYGRIVSDFPQATLAKKASGAKKRLESVGKPLVLRGKTIDGRQFDLSAYKGRVVLVHYWATWCGPCKTDIATIKQLYAKYSARGFSPVGINVDGDHKTASAYLKANRLAWTQLYEAGGLDSPLATELGVLTLPTMLLIDKRGRVINRNIHGAELDAELAKLLVQ